MELSLNGVSNGVSVNVPMHYERGNSGKSTWSFSTIIPKAGEYRYSISVRAAGQNFFSPEFPLKAAKGSGLGIYRLSKKEPSHFYLRGSQNIRGIGVNFPSLLAGDAKEKALDALAEAGANHAARKSLRPDGADSSVRPARRQVQPADAQKFRRPAQFRPKAPA